MLKGGGAYPTESRVWFDTREWTVGVKIRQIASSAISGSYTFVMHQSCRIARPVSASPHPKGAAVEAQRPRPTSDPMPNMN